jgi:hypothetical protein
VKVVFRLYGKRANQLLERAVIPGRKIGIAPMEGVLGCEPANFKR